MCLPHVTEHIEAGLRRREFLKYAGSVAAGLLSTGEALGPPHGPEPDLDLGFSARMEGRAVEFALDLSNPTRKRSAESGFRGRSPPAPRSPGFSRRPAGCRRGLRATKWSGRSSGWGRGRVSDRSATRFA